MSKASTYTVLPKQFTRRPFTVREAALAWGVSSKTAWKRVQHLSSRGVARREGYALYVPAGVEVTSGLPDTGQQVLDALHDLDAYRFALSGFDVLTPFLHYLPARYPHHLLLEERAVEDVRRALSRAGLLAVELRTLPGVWKAGAPIRTVLLKPNANWHGVPVGARKATLERAFLDVLVAARSGAPYPSEDVRRMWDAFDPQLRSRVARLGRNLQIRPFYDSSRSVPAVPAHLNGEPVR